MHALAVVIVPNYSGRADVRPLAARDAALSARIESLLYMFEQPPERAWGVDYSRGFQFDWCVIGGRWEGWGRRVRRLMLKKMKLPRRPIPRFLERNAVWTDWLSRMRIASLDEYPLAVITPHGDWVDCPEELWSGTATVRARNAEAAWLKKVQKIMTAYPDCLAVAVDYHS
jgi:hypothetical protein